MSIVLLVFQMLSLLFQVNKYQVIVHFSRRLLLLISLLTLQSPVVMTSQSLLLIPPFGGVVSFTAGYVA